MYCGNSYMPALDRVSPVPAQMWAGVSPFLVQMWAGEPSPGADVGGAGPVQKQMWEGRA